MRKRSVVAGLLGIVLFSTLLIYSQAAEVPQFTDGSEYAFAAARGSLVHPPGYPIYSEIAGRLVREFPINPYRTLALFSAICQGLFLGLFFLICIRLSGNFAFSLAAAASFFCYEPLLFTGADAEVFALHHLLAAILVGLSCLITTGGRRYGTFFFLGLLCGLGLSHHHMIVLWFPLVAAVIIGKGWKMGRADGIVVAGCLAIFGALIGLSPYWLLFDRYRAHPDLAFAPVRNSVEFVGYVLRAGYGTFSLSSISDAASLNYFPDFLGTGLKSLPLFILGFIPGIYVFFKKRGILQTGILFSALFHLWFAAQLIPGGQEWEAGIIAVRFYTSIMFAAGMVLAMSAPFFTEGKIRRLFLMVLLLGPAFIQLPDSAKKANLRKSKAVSWELKKIFKELPPGSLFLAKSDRIAFGFQYYQEIFAERLDVEFAAVGMLSNKFYDERLKRRLPFLNKLPPKEKLSWPVVARAAYRAGYRVYSNYELRPEKSVKRIPNGILWEWLPEEEVPLKEEVIRGVVNHCQDKWPLEMYKREPRTSSKRVILLNLLSPLKFASKLQLAIPPLEKIISRPPAVGEVQRIQTLCQGLEQGVNKRG